MAQPGIISGGSKVQGRKSPSGVQGQSPGGGLGAKPAESDGWLVGWGLTALLTQNRSYRACRFVGIFYSKL